MSHGHRFIGLVIALVMLLPASGIAQGNSIASLFKEAIPQVSQHIHRIAARGSGVVVKTVCLAASACMLAFTAPDVEAQVPDVTSVVEEARQSFLPGLPEIKTDWWIGTGMYMDNSGKLFTARVGTSMAVANLKAYLTTAWRTHPDMIGKNIDEIDSKVRLYAGFSNRWIGGDNLSYGFSDNNVFVGADRTIFHTARNYLLHHSNRWDELGADFELALLGHEYTDPNAWQTLEDAEAMRVNNASFFRTGITFADLISNDLIRIGTKLNASLGAGDIGIAKIGEVYQAELIDWAGGDDVELIHNLLARGGANLSVNIGQHLTLGTGVDVTRTIGGEIQHGRANGGNFDITRRIISASLKADVIPQYGIAINYNGEWYKQTVDGSIWWADGAEDYRQVSHGVFARATLNKDF